MAYYSLVEGVRGYCLYAPSLSAAFQPTHWKEALRLATEMSHLAPVLAAGKPGADASLNVDSASGSVYFREIQSGRDHVLIAVNMSGGAVVAKWTFKRPTQPVVLFEDRQAMRSSLEMQDVFAPYQVHVYQWGVPKAGG